MAEAQREIQTGMDAPAEAPIAGDGGATAAQPKRPADPRLALWHRRDPAVDAALRAALGTCRPEERGELVRVMLDRRDLAGLVAVVESQDQAGPEERAWVLAAAQEHLDGALRTLMGRASDEGTRHALRLIREAKLGRLAYLLTELIRRGRDGLPEEAAATLVELCAARDAASREAVRSAVDTAVARFDRHRHPGVLEAYLQLLPAPMPAAQGALQTPDHAAGRALGRRLAEATTEVDRRALLPLCDCAALHGAIRRGLVRIGNAPALADALRHGHLLAEPGVGRMLAGVPGSEAARIATGDALAGMPAEARRWVPMLWAKLPLEPGVRLERLASLLDDRDPATRLATLRAVASLTPGEELRDRWAELLVGFSRDAQAGIARAAAAVLDRAASPMVARRATPFRPATAADEPRIPLATVSKLATSPHAAVRATAGRRIGPGAFTRVWEQWPKLEPGRRAATLCALRKLDPGFDPRLLGRLREPESRRDPHAPDPRIRALAWVQALACPPGPLTDAALGLTGVRDPKIAASAVMAAAVASQPGVTELLRRLTRHPDTRVRANAVEALDQRLALEPTDVNAAWPPERLAALIDDDTPRVRANALLALFRRDASAALRPITEMLRDPRDEHRRSALWLAGATGLIEATRAPKDPAAPPDAAQAVTGDKSTHQDRPLGPDRQAPEAPEAFDDPPPPPGVSELLRALDQAIDESHGAAA